MDAYLIYGETGRGAILSVVKINVGLFSVSRFFVSHQLVLLVHSFLCNINLLIYSDGKDLLVSICRVCHVYWW